MAGYGTSTEVLRAGVPDPKPETSLDCPVTEPTLPAPATGSEAASDADAPERTNHVPVNGAVGESGTDATQAPLAEADDEEQVAAAAAKAASAAASRIAFRFRTVRPGDFEPERHFYPRCLNAQIHPSVRFFMGLSRERIVSRYTHLNPRVDPVELRRLLSYRPRFLRWAGCDLMHVVDSRSQRKCMVVIETNSCPSGQKSTPLFDDQDEYGGYRTLLQRALLSHLESPSEQLVPEGKLAVLFDKNPMEASGYAACLAEITNEEVYLVPMLDDSTVERVENESSERRATSLDLSAEAPKAGNATGTSPKAQPVAGASNGRSYAFFRDGVLYVRRLKEQHSESTLMNGGTSPLNRDQVTLVAPPSPTSSAMTKQAEMDTAPSPDAVSLTVGKSAPGQAAAKAQLAYEDGQTEIIPIRAALRYVTQRPWNRIPVQTRTVITNSVVSCLAGGRNKLVAAKAYDNANVELMACGLEIRTPLTIRDVPLDMLARWVDRLGGFAAIKVPYSNAGQGVFTITSQEEFDRFYEAESKRPNRYDKYIVQALISNHEWSSAGAGSSATASMESYSRLYHVGTMPDKRGHIYVSDLRMMICGGPDGFVPVGLYARRARAPLAKEPANNSWEQLGTNLSVKVGEGLFTSESERLMLMDKKDFNLLGLSLDDLIDAFVETCLAVRAIDVMAQWLCSDRDRRFSLSLFRSVCGDDSLIREIMRGSPELRY
ncbi:hypothetical protein CCYA_CCYA12G3239 [Cyanidiococcus yangmingshanensis]|nr:hypothetical protein CCYA_CCYA12G3239 [Cyanidiococcus yangmingshanensis]